MPTDATPPPILTADVVQHRLRMGFDVPDVLADVIEVLIAHEQGIAYHADRLAILEAVVAVRAKAVERPAPDAVADAYRAGFDAGRDDAHEAARTGNRRSLEDIERAIDAALAAYLRHEAAARKGGGE